MRLYTVLLLLPILFGMLSPVGAQDRAQSRWPVVVAPGDSVPVSLIRDPEMYRQGWDTLAQVRFWRRVMNLHPDSSLLNVADTRQVLAVFPTEAYDKLTPSQKQAFKAKMLKKYGLPADTRLYVTYGKQDYYQIRTVLPNLSRGIRRFQEVGTDPWYAQAILLIESPGAIRMSHTGAYGPFQLMKYVAQSQGLIVNSNLDERADFDKSAAAAAKFIQSTCLPHARAILDDYGISYRERDLWFRLLVLHIYHAGAGNVRGVVSLIRPSYGGMALLQKMWQTRYKNFGNASQNYSQIALASLLEVDAILWRDYGVQPDANGLINSGE
ncbi:MAG: hypothetical protein D6722_02910 [Bacteroidetes bacterium]|nr:MAG: hypothetical protein D6722_02910 [Bacteroidota bacterium]